MQIIFFNQPSLPNLDSTEKCFTWMSSLLARTLFLWTEAWYWLWIICYSSDQENYFGTIFCKVEVGTTFSRIIKEHLQTITIISARHSNSFWNWTKEQNLEHESCTRFFLFLPTLFRISANSFVEKRSAEHELWLLDDLLMLQANYVHQSFD